MAEKLYSPDRPQPKTQEDQRRWSQSEFDRIALALEKISQQIEAQQVILDDHEARLVILEPP